MRNIHIADPAARVSDATAHPPFRLRPIGWIASATALVVILAVTSMVAIPTSAGGPSAAEQASRPPQIVVGAGLPAGAFAGPTDGLALTSPEATAGTPPATTGGAGATATPAPGRDGPDPTPPPTHRPAAPPPASCNGTLQGLINAAAPGSTVRLGACTYHEAVTIDKPLTLRGPATVDGDNKRSEGIAVRSDDVTIDGLTVQHVADPAQGGAVDVQGVAHFTLENAVVRNSALICFAARNSSSVRVLDTELAGCGKEGYQLFGDHGVTFQGDRIHGNNAAGKYDSGVEAGGGKAGSSSSLVFHGNQSYGNGGPGFWCDAGCSNVTFSGNRAYGNSRAGIMAEISSGVTITGNAVWENGWGFTSWGWGAGILVSSSAAVTVSGNTVAWNADGISVISQDRGNAAWNDVHDVTVRDNTVVMAPQPGDGSDVMGLAWLQDWNGVLFASGSHNGGGGDAFWWAGGAPRCAYDWSGCLASLSDFNASPGEQGGILLSSSTKAARLAAAGIPAAPIHH